MSNGLIPMPSVIQLDNRQWTINPEQPYFDYVANYTVTTTPIQASALVTLLGFGGLMSSFPQTATPIYNAGYPSLITSVVITHADIVMNVVGSQSTTLASGDLYGSLRVGLFLLGTDYTVNPTPPVLGTITSWYDQTDLLKVYLDQSFDLSSTGYDAANSYNIPATETRKLRVPINQRLDLHSTNTTGTNSWDTKLKDLAFCYVSDSALAPSPSINLSARFFFRFLRN